MGCLVHNWCYIGLCYMATCPDARLNKQAKTARFVTPVCVVYLGKFVGMLCVFIGVSSNSSVTQVDRAACTHPNQGAHRAQFVAQRCAAMIMTSTA